MKSFKSLTDIFKAAAKPKQKEEEQPEKETSGGQMGLFDDLKKADDEDDEDEKRDKKLQQRLDEEAAGGEEAYKLQKEEEEDDDAEKAFSNLEGVDIVKNMAKVQAGMKGGKSAEEAVRAAYPDYTDEEIAEYLNGMKKGYGIYRAKKEKKMIKSDNENTRLVMQLAKGALDESMSIMRGEPTQTQVASALSASIKKGFNIPSDDIEGMILDDLATCDNVARKSFANACMMTETGYPELQVAGDMVGHLEELAQG